MDSTINLLGSSSNSQVINSSISVSTYRGGTESVLQGFELLRQRSVLNALWDSREQYSVKPCDPSTRLLAREKIKDWVLSDKPEASVMWIYGTVGTGKTALARTIAETYKENTLFATFMFSRAIQITNGDLLIPTLGYQILTRMLWPRCMASLNVYRHPHPDLFSKGNEVQMRKLVVDPLNSLLTMVEFYVRSFVQDHTPQLIVIDGLDECSDPDVQCDILRLIANAVSEIRRPIRILISSRPESHLKAVFHNEDIFPPNSLIPFNLEKDKQVANDIKLFLRARFAMLSKSHPLKSHIGTQWPSEGDYSRIVEMASGQFIYAAVVADYVCSADHDPIKRLESVLDRCDRIIDENPYAKLDGLYQYIFDTQVDVHDTILKVLGALLVNPPTPDCQDLYKTPGGIAEAIDILPSQIILLISKFTCLFRMDSSEGALCHDTSIHIRHASMVQFLRNKERSGKFFVDECHTHKIFLEYHHKSIEKAIKSHECVLNTAQSCTHYHGLINRHLIPSILHMTLIETSTPTYKEDLKTVFRTLLSWQDRAVKCRKTLIHEISTSLQTTWNFLHQLDIFYRVIVEDAPAQVGADITTICDTIGVIVAAEAGPTQLELTDLVKIRQIPIDVLEKIRQSDLAYLLNCKGSDRGNRVAHVNSTYIRVENKVFQEFLCDRERSQEFFIDKCEKHRVLARYYEGIVVEFLDGDWSGLLPIAPGHHPSRLGESPGPGKPGEHSEPSSLEPGESSHSSNLKRTEPSGPSKPGIPSGRPSMSGEPHSTPVGGAGQPIRPMATIGRVKPGLESTRNLRGRNQMEMLQEARNLRGRNQMEMLQEARCSAPVPLSSQHQLKQRLAPFIFHQSRSAAEDHNLIHRLIRLLGQHKPCDNCDLANCASSLLKAFPEAITHGLGNSSEVTCTQCLNLKVLLLAISRKRGFKKGVLSRLGYKVSSWVFGS